jgi:hypothetical protein
LRTGSKVREAKSPKSDPASAEPKWRFLSYVLDVP